ncbi:hypothetical protein CH379_011380 [Leptospira ellisii]|uniref:Uncharacterized protein n=1 Tax=Leptospira ellisii TaxID=2023197 RepID=A0AAE4TZ94_9LEPT|nr:hypothetical protein [Leptospira ellisii]MDV6236225.1 hypothetical protein [Leptospira ellisii]
MSENEILIWVLRYSALSTFVSWFMMGIFAGLFWIFCGKFLWKRKE